MSVTREIEVAYGDYVVGTTSGSQGPDGKYRLTRNRERGTIEFRFLVTGATAVEFAENCVDAEEAFQKPYQDLTITLGGETLVDASQSTREALDPIPTIDKGESVGDSGRSRIYTVRVEFGIPADTGAEPVQGLRDYSVSVSYVPQRMRKVTVSGTFTGVGATSARAQHDAQISGLVTTVMSGLSLNSSNYELAEEPSVVHDTNNNLCDFTRVYQELAFSQGGASLNDSELVGQNLSISRRHEGPGDSPTAERLVTLEVSYESGVVFTATTNLRSKYSSIRDWILTQVRNTLNGGSYAVVMESPGYDYDQNRITARWTVVGQSSGEEVLENRVTTDDEDLVGEEVRPVWSGRATDAYTWQGARVIIRTVNQTQKRMGTHTEVSAVRLLGSAVAAAVRRHPYDASGGRWVLILRRPSATPLRLGFGSDTMDITELALTTKLRYVTVPSPVSGSRGTPRLGEITPR